MVLVFCLPGGNFSKSFLECWTSTIIECVKRNIQFYFVTGYSCNIYYVRNMCLGADVSRGKNQKPFDGKIKYDYQFWIDSDIIWSPNQIFNLIDHKKDIVAGYYQFEGGNGCACGKFDYSQKLDKIQDIYTLERIKSFPNKLIEVDYTGFGFIAIKYGVVEKMQYPWFRPKWFGDKFFKDFSMEDVAFCLQAKKLGYNIYIDKEIRVGHEKKAVY